MVDLSKTSVASLEDVFDDGAKHQAQSVLAFLIGEIIRVENYTFNADTKSYDLKVIVRRYDNGREQGYIVSITYKEQTRSYAFYEHRNSDEICVLIADGDISTAENLVSFMWGGRTNKWDYDASFEYGDVYGTCTYITDDMTDFVEQLKIKD